MHRRELFAVGVEADDPLGAIEIGHRLRRLLALGRKAPQNAIETQIEIDFAELPFDALEQSVEALHRVETSGGGEHEPLVDRAEKAQRAVRIDPLDRADKKLAPDTDQHGMRGEGKGVEGRVEDAADAGVFLGGRLGVELLDDALLGVGFGDDHLDRGRLVIVVTEGFERQIGRHQRQNGRVGQRPAVVDDEGLFEPEAVAG